MRDFYIKGAVKDYFCLPLLSFCHIPSLAIHIYSQYNQNCIVSVFGLVIIDIVLNIIKVISVFDVFFIYAVHILSPLNVIFVSFVY